MQVNARAITYDTYTGCCESFYNTVCFIIVIPIPNELSHTTIFNMNYETLVCWQTLPLRYTTKVIVVANNIISRAGNSPSLHPASVHSCTYPEIIFVKLHAFYPGEYPYPLTITIQTAIPSHHITHTMCSRIFQHVNAYIYANWCMN